MFKKLAAFLMVAVLCISTAACKPKEEPKPNGETEKPFDLSLCISSEPETIDPSIISTVDGSTYVQHMYEPLMKYAPTTTKAGKDDSVVTSDVVYGQAKEYKISKDGLTYTFTLRDDAVWSDGKPVKAEDFEYSWKRLTDPETASDYGYLLSGIVKNAAEIQEGTMDPDELAIKALDDKTLEITLVSKCPYFVSLCTFASLVPVRKDVVDAKGAEWTNPENIVTNGPYKLSEWVHDSYIKMVPNKKYYDADKLGPDSITWNLSDSETAILSAYETGTYSFIEQVPSDQIPVLEKSGDLFKLGQMGTYYLYLNNEEIPDWRVRAAISLAIDRENIVTNVTQVGQIPATSFVPLGISDSNGKDWRTEIGDIHCGWLAEKYSDYDLSKYEGRCKLAKALLDEAVKDGKWDMNKTLDYLFNTSDTHQAVAEAVQSDIQNVLGIKLSLSNVEWQTYTNGLEEGNFALARLTWVADYNDPITFLEMFVEGNSYNYGHWVNKDYSENINKAKVLDGGTERDNLMKKAEPLMFQEGGFPMAPLYYFTTIYCLHDGIDNVYYTPLGYFFFTYAKQK